MRKKKLIAIENIHKAIIPFLLFNKCKENERNIFVIFF